MSSDDAIESAIASYTLLSESGPSKRQHLARSCTILLVSGGLLFVGGAATIMSSSVAAITSTAEQTSEQRRVLLTGYLPWGNMTTTNPASEVASRLDGHCWQDVCFSGRTLPVSRKGASEVANELTASSSRWDAVVHLGFESISKGLRVETVAANVLAKEHGRGGWSADVPCNKSEDQPLDRFEDIAPGAPCLLATTAPLEVMALDDGDRGLELWSRDAGTFFCNEIYYRSLRAVRERRIAPRWVTTADPAPLLRPLLPVIFVHLPPLSVSSLEESSDIVARWASLMAGRRPPFHVSTGPQSVPSDTRATESLHLLKAPATAAFDDRQVAMPNGPDGCYAGAQNILAERVEVSLRATPTRADLGVMDLSVNTSPLDASFQCHNVRWSLRADAELLVAPGQPCWDELVLEEVQDLRMRYNSEADTIIIQGHHKVNFLMDIPWMSTLSPADCD